MSRVRELFDAAVELDPERRTEFLNQACGDDSILRAELEQLLVTHSTEAADRIGSYELIRQLGYGGMGTVYLAERQIGKVRQQVALKIVRPGLTANSEIVRRFESEREILASLDHPNIARLIDIGSTNDGVPYLVMDYVAGVPIDDYCNSRALSAHERITLFRNACAVIEYAHSKGVIHRDLKPGNMLVTPEGVLKLLDFGIAKILSSDGEGQVTQTQTGVTLMTIEYASPEQIRGEPVGPETDVYSLGVVLYELLTGSLPYRPETRVPHVVARAICEDQPVTPSTLNKQLAGDLDSILLKALRKKPDWRYHSPTELSEDLRRHMARLRVSAREETLRYRAERILHRILYPAEGAFHSHGMLMLTAGLLGVLLLTERQLISWRWKRSVNYGLDISAVVLWLCWAMWEGRRMVRLGKFSPLDRQSWIAFTVITVALGLLTIVSVLRPLITPEVMAIFWNAGLSIGLLTVGLQANRLMTAGGVALLASSVAASFTRDYSYLCLAIGMFAGMVVPGFILLLPSKKPSRTV